MQKIIIFSLLGDYSKVAEELERELTPKKAVQTICLEKLSKEDITKLLREVMDENTKLKAQVEDGKEEIRLLKEELNDLYLNLDKIRAAFGEMNHFIREAVNVADNLKKEE